MKGRSIPARPIHVAVDRGGWVQDVKCVVDLVEVVT